uniref:Uncharacterized protein n=1 Tax=Anopheles maculatus TaxID=74869 RepID=A0A182SKD2_9DIPT
MGLNIGLTSSRIGGEMIATRLLILRSSTAAKCFALTAAAASAAAAAACKFPSLNSFGSVEPFSFATVDTAVVEPLSGVLVAVVVDGPTAAAAPSFPSLSLSVEAVVPSAAVPPAALSAVAVTSESGDLVAVSSEGFSLSNQFSIVFFLFVLNATNQK